MHIGRLAKIVLYLTIVNAVAAVLFLSGLVDIRGFPGLYVTFPLAAVGYGIFVICLMLETEVAKFDAEHHDHAATEAHPHNIEPLHDHDHHESLAA